MADEDNYSQGLIEVLSDEVREERKVRGRKVVTKVEGTESADLLRKQLRKSKKVEDGTVVRWVSGGYSYAALWISGHWWVTGTACYYGGNKLSNERFIEALSSATEVEIAVAWEQLS